MMMWRSLDQRVLGDVLVAALHRWAERRAPEPETPTVLSPAMSSSDEVATSGPEKGDASG